MSLDNYVTKNAGQNPSISVVCESVEKLFIVAETPLPSKPMDDVSNGQAVESPLRCAISSCFDKGNICCKACDIKKCRYKCNFIDKKVCEHQFI